MCFLKATFQISRNFFRKNEKKCESKVGKKIVIIIETLIDVLLESDCFNKMV